MNNFVVYDSATGTIGYLAYSSDSEADTLTRWPLASGQAILFHEETVTDQNHWHVAGGALTPRTPIEPTLSASTLIANGTDEITISDLPSPCTVTVSGVVTWGPGEITGGELTLTSTTPGRITVRVERNPTHIAWETNLNAAA